MTQTVFSEKWDRSRHAESSEEMSKTTVITATVTVPEQSPARRLSIVTGTPVPATTPSAPRPQDVRKSTLALPPIRYASAVLKGQPHMLEAIAPCFVGSDATVRKLEENVWILESSQFASCTTGEQVFATADDIVSRLNRILSLYCGAAATLSVEYICWVNATGEKLRTLRDTVPVNVFSSKGLAELKTMLGTQPLGSAVIQSMLRDPTVNEALSPRQTRTELVASLRHHRVSWRRRRYR